MRISLQALVRDMLAAAQEVLEAEWPEIREYAEVEFKGIAESIALVQRLRLQGRITQKQARALIKMKRNTAAIQLLTLKGLSLVATERAVNAATRAVRDTVNTAVGFRLL